MDEHHDYVFIYHVGLKAMLYWFESNALTIQAHSQA